MAQEHTTDGTHQATGRDRAALKNRRAFLTDAGKCGALLVGGTYLAAAAGLENRASADDAPEQGWDVKLKQEQVRIFVAGRRAPGLLRGDGDRLPLNARSAVPWDRLRPALLR